ncbi:MAG: FG-GAP repeat domain-containing protein [Bryobacteraceae bacterium]
MQVAKLAAGGPLSLIGLTPFEIHVLIGNADGTFREGPTSSISTQGGEAGILVAADLNGDGNIDLVIGGQINNQGTAGIGVCFGNGDGSFQPEGLFQAATQALVGGLVLADFNGDGILDAAITTDNLPGGESGIWLFTGMGGGVFAPPTLISLKDMGIPGLIVSADVNNDGNPDILITYVLPATNGSGFAVLLGKGDGTFQAPEYFPIPGMAVDLSVGDLNNDGDLDIAVLQNHDNQSNGLLLYFGDGVGGFSEPTFADLPGLAIFTIGDVNGDGIPDLVNSLGYVALGKGNGKFGPPAYYPVDSSLFGPHNPVIATLRPGGPADILVQGSQTVSVLLGDGTGKFKDGVWTAVPDGYGCAVSADFNLDGSPDLAQVTSQGFQVLFGTGKAETPFTQGPVTLLANAVCALSSGDVNGDGIPDLLVAAENPSGSAQGAIYVYLGNRDGSFTLKSTVPLANINTNFAIADFNGDGNPDIATGGYLIAYGNGDGTFQTPVSIFAHAPSCNGFASVVAGDLNNNGYQSLVLSCSAVPALHVLLNNGRGKFSQTVMQIRDTPGGVVLADMNLDGNLDLLVSTFAEQSVYVFLGDGAGQFTLKSGVPFLDGPSPFTAVDVNGDGIPDLELKNIDNVSVFVGKGDGTFARNPIILGAGPSPGDILTGYFHGQSPASGTPDLILPDLTGGVMLLPNLTK